MVLEAELAWGKDPGWFDTLDDEQKARALGRQFYRLAASAAPKLKPVKGPPKPKAANSAKRTKR